MAFDDKQHALPGIVALVGSGEYLPVMREVDTYLLDTIGAAHTARVALLPTASGLEPMGPTSWNNLGLNHFKQLGVDDIRATRIISAESANDPSQVALLEGVNLFYFSGGNPRYTIETLHNSLAWNYIKAAYERGAVLAGCSAGAMMLGGSVLSMRQAMMSNHTELVPALGIVPHLIIAPHFDRMARSLNQERFRELLRTIPSGYTVVGIDEDTALIRIERDVDSSGQDRWRVMGHRTVSVFIGEVLKCVLKNGEEVRL
ncbi:MAG: Type 1 glutamine amidotransferase-like domain-containing protein [Ktedonobacteraceae bacterium]